MLLIILDDVARTGIAMGTPGDKNKISEVVTSISEQKNNEKGDESTIVPTVTESTTTQQPGPSSSEMTVLTRLPPFQPIIPYDIPPSQSAIKLECLEGLPTLEQAHIEDYFTQSKYYPSVSENLQTLYPLLPQEKEEKPAKTFLNLDEPGPSGLQTVKPKVLGDVKTTSTRTKKSQSSPKKSYLCDICQKTFQNPVKLAKHQLIHGGSSPFKCEQCKKTFSTKFKLVRHVLIHSDRKQFSCTICQRTFHRKDHLKNHIKVHSPSKTHYVCDKPNCRKEYTSLLSYKKHLALHAAEDGSLECQMCLKTFENKDQILYHLKIHAGSRTVKNPNEKKYTCDRCDRKFFTRKDVRRHMVVHTGMRDFLCQYCPQRFGRKDHLTRHIKTSHKGLLTSQEGESTQVKSEKSESSIKSELSESSLSNPEVGAAYFETLFPQSFQDLSPKKDVIRPITSTLKELIAVPETETTVTKTEKSESSIKSELSESSLSNPEFNASYFDLFPQTFDQLPPILPAQGPESLQFLPHTSTQGEWKDLGSEVLEEIGEAAEFISQSVPSTSSINSSLLEEQVISDPDILRLLEPENLPLPGFSQTFQSPPPPPPP